MRQLCTCLCVSPAFSSWRLVCHLGLTVSTCDSSPPSLCRKYSPCDRMGSLIPFVDVCFVVWFGWLLRVVCFCFGFVVFVVFVVRCCLCFVGLVVVCLFVVFVVCFCVFVVCLWLVVFFVLFV